MLDVCTGARTAEHSCSSTPVKKDLTNGSSWNRLPYRFIRQEILEQHHVALACLLQELGTRFVALNGASRLIRRAGRSSDVVIKAAALFDNDAARRGTRWKADHELASVAQPFTVRLDGSAVQLRQPAHHCEPNAQAPSCQLGVIRNLHEQVEHTVLPRRVDTNPGVAHPQGNLVFFSRNAHGDGPGSGRVLARVDHEIGHDLLEAPEVTVNPGFGGSGK